VALANARLAAALANMKVDEPAASASGLTPQQQLAQAQARSAAALADMKARLNDPKLKIQPRKFWSHKLGCFTSNLTDKTRNSVRRALTPAEKMTRYRAKRSQAGGRQIAVMLTDVAAAKLDAWIARGETNASIINRLLTRSKPQG
jgi:hypothetical protein